MRGKEFTVSSEEKCVKLIAAFKVMQVNRKNAKHAAYMRKVEQKLAKEKQDMLNARPVLSDMSKLLAERKREKSRIAVPEPVVEETQEDAPDEQVPKTRPKTATIHSRLYEQRIDIKKQKQQWEEKKTIKGIEECTFVPNADKKRDAGTEPKQISDRLHSKKLEARLYGGRSTQEIEYERSKQTLTFQPDIQSKWKKPIESAR